ncbi:MAG: DUF445 domain-containing protein [Acidimicrobiia bacterium]|nr:DUF445 domain-containing protein [Acidimicrobiia bacterium]
MATPFDTAYDEDRARRLRRAKSSAGGLLVLAALVFFATYAATDGEGVWGYVRAASEAAMVGGVADWFAVTALFRHPLRIPIPHTALIPRGKDAIGVGIGEFVQRNFLDPSTLAARIDEADMASRLGVWLDDERHAALVAGQLASIIAGVAEAMEDDVVESGIRSMIEARLRSIEVAPIIGTVIDKSMEGGHHHAMIDAALRGLVSAATENRAIIREQIRKESPWWVPEAMDEVLLDKILGALQRFVADVTGRPDHPIRIQLDARARLIADDLRTSPELRDRGEQLKEEMLGHPEFMAWADTIWSDVKQNLQAAIDRPDSELRRRLESAVRSFGARLGSDADLRHRVNTWIGSLTHQLAARSGGEIAGLIAETVQRWDAEETSRRLELQVGRDLQYIRINGTLVGGLVGLIIHTAVELFG